MSRIEPRPWRGIRVVEKVILFLLFALAAVVLALPLLDPVMVRRMARLPGTRPIVVWLINDYNTWIVGGVMLLLFAFFVLLVRRRLLSDRHLWFGTGCPECEERELIRVTRQTSDRLYGLIGVPAYRYACRNCTWRGLRIARREYTPEQIAELEASLLRFDPDSPPIVIEDAESVAEAAPVSAAESISAAETAADPWSAVQPVSETVAPIEPDGVDGDEGDTEEVFVDDRIVDNDADADPEEDFDDELAEILDRTNQNASADGPAGSNHKTDATPSDELGWLWRDDSDD